MLISEIKDLFDILQKLFTILAITAGGVWSYFHYFKRRMYRLRLEPYVLGSLVSRDGITYLIAISKLKNMGISRVKIEQRGTALRINEYCPINDGLDDTRSVKARHIATFPVFEHHGWIESGEIIEDQRMIAITTNEQVGLNLELRVVSKGISWRAKKIIKLPSK